jgi:hypothetical protein
VTPCQSSPCCGCKCDIVVVISSTNVRQYRQRCTCCGHVSGRSIAYGRLSPNQRAAAEVVYRSAPKEYEPCAYRDCRNVPTELHHWAPRALFPDADNWPQDYLCVKTHHPRWHKVMETPGFDKASRPSQVSIGLARQQLGRYWDERTLTMATG